MNFDDRIKKAEEIKKSSHDDEAPSDRAPSVEVAEIYRKIADILTDEDKEIFSQLDKAKLGNLMVDETKQFATAVDFALNPLPDIEMEFARRGIMRRIKVGTDMVEGEEVDKFDYKPITFQVKPLITFSHEWLKKRHYVNRKRVQELIELIRAIRMGEAVQPKPIQAQDGTLKPPTRI